MKIEEYIEVDFVSDSPEFVQVRLSMSKDKTKLYGVEIVNTYLWDINDINLTIEALQTIKDKMESGEIPKF